MGLHIHVLIANFFGFTISVVFNYIMSMKFVFERKEDMDRKAEFAMFVILKNKPKENDSEYVAVFENEDLGENENDQDN